MRAQDSFFQIINMHTINRLFEVHETGHELEVLFTVL